ncbi:hypothetical protein [Streptomyces tendae]|uniref:hypothetical protein n=1 Tax=Streptomyces tendae TaxID=1932 RepID=UPI003D73DBBE
MQMSADQLIAEFKDTVLDLHFARRHIAVLEAENASLRAQLPSEPTESTGSPASRPKPPAPGVPGCGSP